MAPEFLVYWASGVCRQVSGGLHLICYHYFHLVIITFFIIIVVSQIVINGNTYFERKSNKCWSALHFHQIRCRLKFLLSISQYNNGNTLFKCRCTFCPHAPTAGALTAGIYRKRHNTAGHSTCVVVHRSDFKPRVAVLHRP